MSYSDNNLADTILKSNPARRLSRLPALTTHVVGSYPAKPENAEEIRAYTRCIHSDCLTDETRALLEDPVEYIILNHPCDEKKKAMLEEIIEFAPILKPMRTAIEAQLAAGLDVITDGQTITNMINYVTDRLRNVRHHKKPVVLKKPERRFPLLQVDILSLKAFSIIIRTGLVPDWCLSSIALNASANFPHYSGKLEDIERTVRTIAKGLRKEMQVILPQIPIKLPALKAPIAGPYTLSCSVKDERYKNDKIHAGAGSGESGRRELVFELAKVYNEELRKVSELELVDVVQIDEPFLSTQWFEGYEDVAGKMLEGVNTITSIHICGNISKSIPEILSLPFEIIDNEFAAYLEQLDTLLDYSFEQAVGLGVVRSDSNQIESPAQIEEKITHALRKIAPERVYPDPDCGLRNLLPASANSKLINLVEATRRVKEKVLGMACKS